MPIDIRAQYAALIASGKIERDAAQQEALELLAGLETRLRHSSSRQVADYLATRPFLTPLSFRVSRFVLFSSRASVGGGPYVVEAAYPLAA